jgi:hypothetical protein
MNIDMTKYWYSPSYVIYMAEELINIYGQKNIDKDTFFQKVGEMKCTAIMLLGLHKVFGTQFFMQSSLDQSPDVWTLYQEEVSGKNVNTKYQTVEVITYEIHANIPVVDFILKNKLINPKKAYDKETIILCYIRKAGTYIDFSLLYQELEKHKFKPTRVFVIGNEMKDPQIFLLSQVWPTIHHEAIHYIERTKAYPSPHRMYFKRGVSKKINYKTEGSTLQTNPYEVFNLNEKFLKNKYNIS